MYLNNPQPDIQEIIAILTGKKKANTVKYLELIIDDEILEQYTHKYLKKPWVPYQRGDLTKRALYWDNVIECYYRLGYSGLRVSNGLTFNIEMKKADDTATLSRGERKWSNHEGKIKDFESFNNYPWPKITDLDLWDYEYVSKHLYPGMGILACVYGGIFEMLCEYLVGFEDLSYMTIDNEELLEQIFTKVGDILYQAYEKIITIENVAAIFQGDDLGYTQGLFFSPDFYNKYVLPWHKKLVNLAHKHNKDYFLHSCGNLRALKDDLIALELDAKHSYEDKGWSVIDFYEEMHPYMGIIGGVDVDKLCRMEKEEFKVYCLNILDKCMKHGRYVFGSGNSIANYVPLEKFLLMLEIASNYKARENNE